MLKKVLSVTITVISLTSCANWYGSSQETQNNPAVDGRQDSSDMLFEEAESTTALGASENIGNTTKPSTTSGVSSVSK